MLSFDYRVFQFVRPDILSTTYSGIIQQTNDLSRQEAITAPLGGKIIKINYKVGQKINKGDILLLIESMKMENEIRIHFDGIIKQILVKEGDRVIEGELLMELEFS